MGRLDELGLKYGTDKASNGHNFLDFYEANLPHNPKRILEIGAYEGASLKMWRDYYPEAEIVGIDIWKQLDIDGVKMLIMDATDEEAMRSLGKFDIIIDDGSHKMAQQQTALKYGLDFMLNEGGVFIMEDLHCCYWEEMQDDSPQTTEEVLKEMEGVEYFIHEDKTQHYTAIIRTKNTASQ